MQGHEGQLTAELVDRQTRATTAMRAALVAGGAEMLTMSAYDIFLWPAGDIFYRSLALPHAPEAADRVAIADLRIRFERLGREPRVEFFAESWPGLQPALLRAGWRTEMDMPAMWLDRHAVLPPDPALVILHGGTSPSILHGFLAGMGATFATAAPPSAAEIARLRQSLAAGRVIALAATLDARIIGGAALTRHGDTAELQGVWVAPECRGRGQGERLCRALLARFLAAPGRMVWLSAGGIDSLRLYDRLGFKPMGSQLNLCLSPTQP